VVIKINKVGGKESSNFEKVSNQKCTDHWLARTQAGCSLINGAYECWVIFCILSE